MTASGCGNQEFQYQTNSRLTSFIENETLLIEPNLTKIIASEDPMQEGVILEPGGAFPDICSDINLQGCSRQSKGKNIINPVVSAKITTQKSFSFKYGKLEIIAKLPCGDWTWPAIWLLPKHNYQGTWPCSGEIDIMESRGNIGAMSADNKKIGPEAFGSTLHWGPRWDQNKWWLTYEEYALKYGKIEYIINLGTFCDAFHTFGLIWQKGLIKIQLDSESNTIAAYDVTNLWKKGEQKGRNIWTSNIGAPFDQEFFLIFNVAIGGTTFFPDDGKQIGAKPWKNNAQFASFDFYSKLSAWYPTWNSHAAALQIKKVTIWATEETEYTYHKN